MLLVQRLTVRTTVLFCLGLGSQPTLQNGHQMLSSSTVLRVPAPQTGCVCDGDWPLAKQLDPMGPSLLHIDI